MKAFGSGYFGEWITDENGLPAYRYDCNQLKDPAAVSPTNTVWRKENDHTFQFGNTRITCVASNFGTVQVRQDEGSPKFLGDIDPENHVYGGGIGWLKIDNDDKPADIISTYYNGNVEDFERVYGTGYMCKTVIKNDFSVKQTIFTPHGDDPILISRVTIKNRSNQPKKIKWYEYWGARPYLMSMRTLVLSLAIKNGQLDTYINNSAQSMRRKLADKYKNYFSVENSKKFLNQNPTQNSEQASGQNSVLRNKMKFTGWGFIDKKIWGIAQKKYRPLVESRNNYSLYIGELDDQEDVNPPETFLAVLSSDSSDAGETEYITDAEKFFGKGEVENPDGLNKQVKTKIKPGHTAMIAATPATVPANGSVTLTYIYGYIPKGFDTGSLIEKYSGDYDLLFNKSCENWKNDRISLSVPNEDWIDRELLWHNQSLIGATTYDSAFGEHILSQGHVYQYIMGFQGASRDPLQHVMPFIFTNPGLVREVLRYTAKSVLPDGTVPYGICGNGAIMVTPFLSDDLELWFLWTLSEYILATKDLSILKEKVVPYPYKGEQQPEDTVLNLAERALKHFLTFTGTGVNGLPRLLGGDWNDNVVVGNTDPAEQDRIYKEGESVLVGAFASAVLFKYADILAMAGKDNKVAHNFAVKQREAVAKQWTGKRFRRAYLGSKLGWVEDEKLWLEPQPWAMMCGAADPEQIKILADEIREKCQDPSPIGAMLSDIAIETGYKAPKGMATNAGIWPSINGTLIMALNKIDPAAAYKEWRKNTLAVHSEEYPKSWEGTWSGPDTFNSVLSSDPGRTFSIADPEQRKLKLAWTDYPVYNLHPHAWTLYNAASMFADTFTTDGAVFNMGFPESEYEFSSPLAALKRTSFGFEGIYCPAVSGNWKIELVFFDPFASFRLEVNGVNTGYDKTEKGIIFMGLGGDNEPLKWKITFV